MSQHAINHFMSSIVALAHF